MNEPERLLTPDEAGQILCLTSTQVSRMASRGALPCIRLPNGQYRFRHRDLWAWIDQRQKEPVT